jgi:hypothetical protein
LTLIALRVFAAEDDGGEVRVRERVRATHHLGHVLDRNLFEHFDGGRERLFGVAKAIHHFAHLK